MKQYVLRPEILKMKKAKHFRELAPIAIQIASRLTRPVTQVCGPVSTGGRGSIEKNMKALKDAILFVGNQGFSVFDQTIFEKHLWRISGLPALKNASEYLLLDSFYRPIFLSKKLQYLHFIPGWQGSVGAVWEHSLGKSLGIKIVYL